MFLYGTSYWKKFAVVQDPQKVVSYVPGGKCEATFDVIVCGGTLGIFIATALSLRGLQVGIVERNILKGVSKLLISILCKLSERTNVWSCLQFSERYSFVYHCQREQEWNISRKELLELVEVGILTEDEIDLAVAASFNPVWR